MTTSLPLSLYVHLPWCIRKCPYCDFNSYELRGELPERRYVEALLRDLESELPGTGGRPLESIFIGGGTPSLFSGSSIALLLEGISSRVPLASDIEITLEANPGSAEAERFADFRDAGVNRLSIGVQSFRDAELSALGRVHSAADAIAAVRAARSAGFSNLNLDLMYGLPGDSPEAALADLEQAIALGPAHLSWYQLTLEPQTHFERHPPVLPDDETILAIESAGRALLHESGFERYEISAYARPRHRCRHNLNYWRFGDYIGIGAGAHGKLTLGPATIERRAKPRNPRTYIETAGELTATTLERIDSDEALVTEFLMNALRLPEGVESDLLMARTGLSAAQIPGLDAAKSRGWLREDSGRLQATPAGLQSLNRLLALL